MWGYRWNKLMQEELWRNVPTLERRWMIGRNVFEDYQSYFFQQRAQAQPRPACVKDSLGQVFLLLWLFLWKHSVGSASVKTKVSNRKSSKTTTTKSSLLCVSPWFSCSLNWLISQPNAEWSLLHEIAPHFTSCLIKALYVYSVVSWNIVHFFGEARSVSCSGYGPSFSKAAPTWVVLRSGRPLLEDWWPSWAIEWSSSLSRDDVYHFTTHVPPGMNGLLLPPLWRTDGSAPRPHLSFALV